MVDSTFNLVAIVASVSGMPNAIAKPNIDISTLNFVHQIYGEGMLKVEDIARLEHETSGTTVHRIGNISIGDKCTLVLGVEMQQGGTRNHIFLVKHAPGYAITIVSMDKFADMWSDIVVSSTTKQ